MTIVIIIALTIILCIFVPQGTYKILEKIFGKIPDQECYYCWEWFFTYPGHHYTSICSSCNLNKESRTTEENEYYQTKNALANDDYRAQQYEGMMDRLQPDDYMARAIIKTVMQELINKD